MWLISIYRVYYRPLLIIISKQDTPRYRYVVLCGPVFLRHGCAHIDRFVQNFSSTMGAEYTFENVRRQMFAKLHRMGMRYFDQVPGGSILSRLTDTMSFSNFWALFNTLFTAFFAVISSFVAMYLTDAQIALWLLVFMPFLAVTIWYYQRYSSRVYRRMRERLSELNTKLSEAITGT